MVTTTATDAPYTTQWQWKRTLEVRLVPGRSHTLNTAFSLLGKANISLPLETNLSSNASGIPWFIACVCGEKSRLSHTRERILRCG